MYIENQGRIENATRKVTWSQPSFDSQAYCVGLGEVGILVRSSCTFYQASIVSKWEYCVETNLYCFRHVRDIVNRARELQQVGIQEVEPFCRRSGQYHYKPVDAVTISIGVSIALSSICRTVISP